MPEKESKLHLKIRVIAERRMSVGELREKLQRTVRTGIVQEGIRLAWIDWRNPDRKGAAAGGTYLKEAARDALADFYGAIHHDDTGVRVEVVHEG